MYSNIIASLRREICNELAIRTKDKCFTFREMDDLGEEEIFFDLAVGYPDQEHDGYFPEVTCVQGNGEKVSVTVRDYYGNYRDIVISEIELSVQDLSFILDAIINENVHAIN